MVKTDTFKLTHRKKSFANRNQEPVLVLLHVLSGVTHLKLSQSMMCRESYLCFTTGQEDRYK